MLGEVFKTKLGGRWQVISVNPCPPSANQTLEFLVVRYPWSLLPTPLRTFSYNLDQVADWCGLSDLPPKSSLPTIARQDIVPLTASSERSGGPSSQTMELNAPKEAPAPSASTEPQIAVDLTVRARQSKQNPEP